MPRFRFHSVITGEIDAPDADSALMTVDEFIQVGNGLPEGLTMLDTQVHEVKHHRTIQQVGSPEIQLDLLTVLQ